MCAKTALKPGSTSTLPHFYPCAQPDKNNDASAPKRFQQIAEAYEARHVRMTLSFSYHCAHLSLC